MQAFTESISFFISHYLPQTCHPHNDYVCSPTYDHLMDEDQLTTAPKRLSTDTLANINEDVTLVSELSGNSRPAFSESVLSSLRQSLDGGSNHVGAFNILKQLTGPDDDKILAEGSPLGPNSIYDLTAALDQARLRLNRGLKTTVLINGGANKVYNLVKPSTREIPSINLEPLRQKVAKTELFALLVDTVSSDYKEFELSYKSLTSDTLSRLSQQYEENEDLDDNDNSVENLEQEERPKIPEIFESSDFHLEDQRVFRQVMEGSSIFPENNSSQELQLVHNSKVQESLSHYLDTVEVDIIEEVSQTADSFFATLEDIDDIKLESHKCIQNYDGLMASLDTVKEKQADVGLELLNLIDQHRNVNHLESSVLRIDAFLKGFDRALSLVNEAKNIECLDQILVLESILYGVPREDHPDPESLHLYPKFSYHVVDLSNLNALKNKQKSLEALKSQCCRGYIDNFIDVLLQDLKTYSASVSTSDTINRIYSSTSRTAKKNETHPLSYNYIDPEFRVQISVFVRNLAKSGHLILAFAQYQDKIIREVKAIIRNRLPTFKEDDGQMDNLVSNSNASDRHNNARTSKNAEQIAVAGSNTNGSLTSSLKSMSDEEFLDMMRGIYANLSECLRRLTAHQKFLLDISLSSLSHEASHEIDVISLDISNSIYKAIELTQVRLTKVLNVRLEPLGDLSLEDYLKVFLLTSGYLQECESINPGYNATEQGSSLNEWTKNHLNYYCHRTHTSALKKLVGLCEKEIWREYTGPALVPAQIGINEISNYASFTASGSGFDGSTWVDIYLDFHMEAKPVTIGNFAVDIKDPQTKLKVEEHSFFVPSFTSVVVQTVKDYVVFTRIFNNKSRNVVQNLLTYFKVLNSRVSMAILSAGALKTAGLKHITTRHLALCLQTVEFFIAFLKRIQVIYTSQNAFSQPSNDTEKHTFELVIKSFEDHEQALFAKVISIMYDRTTNHCAALFGLDLSQSVTYPKQCHTYMETLVRETQTVSNVLGKYIGETELTFILLQIFDNYKKLLVNFFCSDLPQLKDFNEKHSLLKDIDYFRVKLGDLPGYGNSGQVIWENVNSLPTLEDSNMEEVMRSNIEDERAAKSARASMEQACVGPNQGVNNMEKEEEKRERAVRKLSPEIETKVETEKDDETLEKTSKEKTPTETSDGEEHRKKDVLESAKVNEKEPEGKIRDSDSM